MRILMINVVCGIRSTGRICTDLAVALETQGHEVKIAYGREDVPAEFQKYAIRIGTDFDVKFHGIKARLFDGCGFGSSRATKRFIKWVKEYNPDVIHLHNLHGYYINIAILFSYLRKCGKRIIWTLHDCWAFTGHAAYCEAAHCERWTSGCYRCPKLKDYPISYMDRCSRNWKKKKNIMKNIPNLTIITPSIWLANLVKSSYLSEYNVKIIHNGIDTQVFRILKENEYHSHFGKDKIVVMGIAAVWDERKGLRDFYILRNNLDCERYIILLIGLTKKQIVSLPEGIIGIERTNSVKELVEYYNEADVFINPTYEDNYPTTNLESIACGTPVITYATGGSGESAKFFGKSVSQGDVNSLVQEIMNLKNIKKLTNSNDMINKQYMIDKYVRLFDCGKE